MMTKTDVQPQDSQTDLEKAQRRIEAYAKETLNSHAKAKAPERKSTELEAAQAELRQRLGFDSSVTGELAEIRRKIEDLQAREADIDAAKVHVLNEARKAQAAILEAEAVQREHEAEEVKQRIAMKVTAANETAKVYETQWNALGEDVKLYHNLTGSRLDLLNRASTESGR